MKTPTAKKLPSGQWRVQLMIDGQRLNVTRPTKQAAEREAALMKAEHLNGIKNSAAGVGITLEAAVDEYIADRENTLSPSTIRGYRIIQRTRFQSVMNKPLTKIQWQPVINAEARITSPKTIRNAFSFIGSVYRANDLTLPEIRLPAPEVKEKPFLTPEQIPVFVDACAKNKYRIGILLGLCGLRRSEIYGLAWDDIDLDGNRIRIHQSSVMNEQQEAVLRGKNKNPASTRTIPIMIPALRDALKAVPEEKRTGAVIKAHLNTINENVNRICERAGLPKVGLHGLRHSFASLCYSLGIPEMQCMRLGGWSDYGTMRKIYTHLSETDNTKTDKKLSDFFDFHT